jgi:GT2 family glycosyltransferase
MARTNLFMKVGGFNQEITAGEEPELCYRLRKLGYEIHRLDAPMVFHDAAMTRFSLWWKRSVRTGYGYAQGYALHGRGAERYCLRQSLRIWFWGLMVPGGIVLLALFFGSQWLSLVAIYPIQIFRITASVNKRFNHWQHSLLYASFTLLGKWPQLYGQVLFLVRRISNNPPSLIECK